MLLDDWFAKELLEKRVILQKFWDERIINFNGDSVTAFLNSIIRQHFPNDPQYNEEITKLFRDAAAGTIRFEEFFEKLKFIPLGNIRDMNWVEKLVDPRTLSPQKIEVASLEVTGSDIANIKRYMTDKNMSAVVSLGNTQTELTTLVSEGNKPSDVFCMLSVGKIFTGMLIFKLLEKGVINEHDLNSPIRLDEAIMSKLPTNVQERLKTVTWHQLMTHMAGIGDYAEKYEQDIVSRNSRHEPQISSMRELLSLIDENVSPVDKRRYSNAGMLLLGFAIEHAYKEKFGSHLDYNAILQQYIIDEVGMTSFSTRMPESTEQHQAKRNPADTVVAPNLIGSPAGAGTWISIGDLAKFGQWIYKESRKNPRLKAFLEKYGQEFYDQERQLISHAGGSPSASAHFSVSLKTGSQVAIMSNQPDMAADLNMMVRGEVFFKPPAQAPEERPPVTFIP